MTEKKFDIINLKYIELNQNKTNVEKLVDSKWNETKWNYIKLQKKNKNNKNIKKASETRLATVFLWSQNVEAVGFFFARLLQFLLLFCSSIFFTDRAEDSCIFFVFLVFAYLYMFIYHSFTLRIFTDFVHYINDNDKNYRV